MVLRRVKTLLKLALNYQTYHLVDNSSRSVDHLFRGVLKWAKLPQEQMMTAFWLMQSDFSKKASFDTQICTPRNWYPWRRRHVAFKLRYAERAVAALNSHIALLSQWNWHKRGEQLQAFVKWQIIFWKPTPQIMLSREETPTTFALPSCWIWLQESILNLFEIRKCAEIVLMKNTHLQRIVIE